MHSHKRSQAVRSSEWFILAHDQVLLYDRTWAHLQAPPPSRIGSHCLRMCKIFSIKRFVHLLYSYAEDHTNQPSSHHHFNSQRCYTIITQSSSSHISIFCSQKYAAVSLNGSPLASQTSQPAITQSSTIKTNSKKNASKAKKCTYSRPLTSANYGNTLGMDLRVNMLNRYYENTCVSQHIGPPQQSSIHENESCVQQSVTQNIQFPADLSVINC